MLPVINVKHGKENLISHSELLPVGTLLESLQLTQRLENLPDVQEMSMLAHSLKVYGIMIQILQKPVTK